MMYHHNTAQVNDPEWSNCAGNIGYSAERIVYPETLIELQEIIRKAPLVKALGSRHSFNTVADTLGVQICMDRCNRIIELDTGNNTVTVEGGVRYGELAPYLHQRGFALHNLASLPHISIAGACATATHGSGYHHGNLATALQAIEIVDAQGNLHHLSSDDEAFFGAVVNLGALGVVARLTLQLEPTYNISQVVYRHLPLQTLLTHFDEIMSAGYSVSCFTNWQNGNVSELWVKSKVTSTHSNSAALFFGAEAANEQLHPIDDQPAENCTDQLGVAGAWHDRLPHFKMGFKPSAGKELQSEYFIPIDRAAAAIQQVSALKDLVAPHILISEIRTVAADDFWLSPCYQQACVALHTTWKQHPEVLQTVLPAVEAVLLPFGAVPHWGKLFTMSARAITARYSRFSDFVALKIKFDPAGKFSNHFLTALGC